MAHVHILVKATDSGVYLGSTVGGGGGKATPDPPAVQLQNTGVFPIFFYKFIHFVLTNK